MRYRQYVFGLILLSGCSGEVVLDRQAPATFHIEPGGYEQARVERVVDGDTIEVRISSVDEGPGAGTVDVGEEYDVRLIGIDTPESVKPGAPVECFGREAASAAEALLEGRTVRLVDDVENVDSYGRLLRYVYLGDEMANARLVANGYASAYTYPPNVRHSRLLSDLQSRAEANNAGFWSPNTCDGRP
ncbi:MAG: thermonuclease family protein [Actinomycetota bacterium]|nr:thermonuclease family protein [Actinomycetota bacterium]